MDLPRTPKSGAVSAVPDSLFQISQVPHERVPRDRWASPGIVDWSRLRDFRERLSKIESVESQKRHMSDVEGTIDPAGVLGVFVERLYVASILCPRYLPRVRADAFNGSSADD